MLAIRLTVPIACWRKGHARELLETELVPPPATCYGALLSFVGEVDRDRHRGARVTGAIQGRPDRSTVVRTTWRVKSPGSPPGDGDNAKPDFQQLLTCCDVLIWLDSAGETAAPTLEERVREAFLDPGLVERFGGWSLGESTHLVNDAWLLAEQPPGEWSVFVVDAAGGVTLPVWVDHVGTARTRYAVGALKPLGRTPLATELPVIE